jgi:Flp pilus assembly protein TadD
MAMLHAQLGNLGAAERALRSALQAEPEDAAVNYNLGLLLVERGGIDEAKQRLRAALEADPNLAGAAYNLAGLLVDERLDEALGLYRRAWRLEPGRARYAEALAWALRRAGREDEARAVLEQAKREQR